MKVFTTALGLMASANSAMGALQAVTGFGDNPSNLQMYISVPARVATNPAIIVAVSPLLKKLVYQIWD
jgi:acetylxylan esterase